MYTMIDWPAMCTQSWFDMYICLKKQRVHWLQNIDMYIVLKNNVYTNCKFLHLQHREAYDLSVLSNSAKEDCV